MKYLIISTSLIDICDEEQGSSSLIINIIIPNQEDQEAHYMKKMEFGAYVLTLEILLFFYKIEKFVIFNEEFQNHQPT